MAFYLSANAWHSVDLFLFQKELLLVINEKVVSSLATRVLKSSESLIPVLFESATESPRNKCLALAVLLRVLLEAPEGTFKCPRVHAAVFRLSLRIHLCYNQSDGVLAEPTGLLIGRALLFADSRLDVVKASLPWLGDQLAVLESEPGFDLKNATIQQVLLM